MTGTIGAMLRRVVVNLSISGNLVAKNAGLVPVFCRKDWGFLTEGWLIRKDIAVSAALYRSSDLQMKYMPFGLASVLVALLAAFAIYGRWCGATSGAAPGLQFGILMGVSVACIHPISNPITMNMDVKPGLEIGASNSIGWVLARGRDRYGLQAGDALELPLLNQQLAADCAQWYSKSMLRRMF
jgi:hypothetical protein